MMKKIKRVGIAALALIMVAIPLSALARDVADDAPAVSVSPPVAASFVSRTPAAGEGMEVALIAVRNLIDIDDSIFINFSYNSSFRNWETQEGLIWFFDWSGDNAFISATVTEQGQLLSFNMWTEGPGFGFGNISEQAAISAANAFIEAANPMIYRFFAAPVSVTTNLHSSVINLTYNASINGYHFPTSSIDVRVNKFTGQVVGYNLRNIDPSRFDFEEADSIISLNDAIAAFDREIGMTLEYRSSFDWNTNELSIFPVYTKNDVGQRFISAVTGEVIDFVFDLGEQAEFGYGAQAEDSAPAATAGMARGRENLSPAELAAIERVSGFITREEAISQLLTAIGVSGLTADVFDDKFISLDGVWNDSERFVYNISLWRTPEWDAANDEIRGITGVVDALSGRVRAFDIWYHGVPFRTDGQAMSADQVSAQVDAFLQTIAPDEMRNVRATSLPIIAVPQPRAVGMETVWASDGNHFFRYDRVVNDILFRDNNIFVTFNEVTGIVTSFNLNWFDNVTFPSISNVLSPRDALTRFLDENDSQIIYITTGEGNARLVYDFGSGLINPFTGGAIDFMGNAVEELQFHPDYSDVIGHWSEAVVMRLLENGVYNWSGNFLPDRVMNEVEFVSYIMLIEGSWMGHLSPVEFLRQSSIDFTPSAGRNVTRQVAARIIVELLGYGRLAEQSQWFVYPFDDFVSSEYRGFITIAHMLDIVGGDADNNFNAANPVTRAQAAVMLHNLILVQMGTST